MVLASKTKRKKITILPAYVVYEEIDGKALPYKGFKEVLSKEKKIEEIMGSSALQAYIVHLLNGFLFNSLDRKKYFILTNESGVNLSKGNNLANDVAIFLRDESNSFLKKEYMKSAPILAIEVDTKIEFDEETYEEPKDYFVNKSNKLLEFGTEKVIWILTESKKIFIAVPGKEWKIVDFDSDILLVDNCILNLDKLLKEEGVEF